MNKAKKINIPTAPPRFMYEKFFINWVIKTVKKSKSSDKTDASIASKVRSLKRNNPTIKPRMPPARLIQNHQEGTKLSASMFPQPIPNSI